MDQISLLAARDGYISEDHKPKARSGFATRRAWIANVKDLVKSHGGKWSRSFRTRSRSWKYTNLEEQERDQKKAVPEKDDHSTRHGVPDRRARSRREKRLWRAIVSALGDVADFTLLFLEDVADFALFLLEVDIDDVDDKGCEIGALIFFCIRGVVDLMLWPFFVRV